MAGNWLTIRFRRTARTAGETISGGPLGGGYSRSVATAGISPTRCSGCFNLLPRPYVRFRQFHLLFGTGYLTLVSLLYPFVHTPRYTVRTVAEHILGKDGFGPDRSRANQFVREGLDLQGWGRRYYGKRHSPSFRLDV